ncbi:MAG: hypothetical protein GY925_29960 [Actinomycetia bacterium]|nr:hypothetical protein [Actinomycetes bacterium]
MDEEQVDPSRLDPPPPAAWRLPAELPTPKRLSVGHLASTVGQGVLVAVSAGIVPMAIV